MKQEDLPSDTTEYKELLGVEKWEEIFMSGDKMKIQEEMGALQESLKELKEMVC
jgi:hypothetical protein